MSANASAPVSNSGKGVFSALTNMLKPKNAAMPPLARPGTASGGINQSPLGSPTTGGRRRSRRMSRKSKKSKKSRKASKKSKKSRKSRKSRKNRKYRK
jgi:hypothetical protein